MLAYAKENNDKSAAVTGGGLLGLEAIADMQVKSHIVKFANIIMCCQVRLHIMCTFFHYSMDMHVLAAHSLLYINYFHIIYFHPRFCID